MTQKEHVLYHMNKIGSISPMEAMRDYTITCLAERIRDLKEDGYNIETEMRTNPATGRKYARYRLV